MTVPPAMADLAIAHTYTISASAGTAVMVEDRREGYLRQRLAMDDHGPALIPPATLQALVRAGNEGRRRLHEAEAVCARLVEVICEQDCRIGLLEIAWEAERDAHLEAAHDLRRAVSGEVTEGLTEALALLKAIRLSRRPGRPADWDAVVDDWTAATEADAHIVRGES